MQVPLYIMPVISVILFALALKMPPWRGANLGSNCLTVTLPGHRFSFPAGLSRGETCYPASTGCFPFG